MKRPTGLELATPAALRSPVYVPGRPVGEVAADLGLQPEAIVKLASNENPLGPSPRATEAARRVLDQQHRYPEGGSTRLRETIAAELSMHPDQIVCGNGSNEILELIARIFSGPGKSVHHGAEGFIVYKLAALHAGSEPIAAPMRPDGSHDLEALLSSLNEKSALVCVASPNNPTGGHNENGEIDRFIRRLPPWVIAVIDEAYVDYLEESSILRSLIEEGFPVIGTRTFSKIHGLAGYRVGYAYGRKDLIELISRNRDPFNVNFPGQEAARAALGDLDFLERSRLENRAGLRRLASILGRFGIPSPPSRANFRLARVRDGAAAAAALLRAGIIVRPLQPYGMQQDLRISVGLPHELDRLEEALATLQSGMEAWSAFVRS